MNKKGFAPIIVLVLIGTLIVAGGIYIFDKKNLQSNDKIENWKTYADTDYGFELKYPEDYSLVKSGSTISMESSEACKSRQAGGGSWPEKCISYGLLMQKNKISIEGLGIVKTTIQTAGYLAEKIETSSGMWDGLSQTIVQFNKDGEWYINPLSFNAANEVAAEAILEKILSTLKFKKSDVQASISGWKTYTNTDWGYSFEYPEKLSLTTSGGILNLSHSIPFENRDGGCDMKGDSVLSKTLVDFSLSINIASGDATPAYVHGDYSTGVLNGKWVYMGAEGCGQTSYYFPMSANRTLIVSKSEVQILSNVVTSEVRAKVLAVPGVISQEDGKALVDQILSTFKLFQPLSFVTVISPNGGEKLESGETLKISWKSSPDIKTVNIRLNILGNPDSQHFSAAIASNVPNTGSYEWVVKKLFAEVLGITDLPKSDKYSISVGAGPKIYDSSDEPFSIGFN